MTPTEALESILEAPDPVVDRRINLLVVVSVLVMLFMVTVTTISLVRNWGVPDNTGAIERSADIQGCRSLLNSQTVGESDTALNVADKQLSRARAELDLVETDLLEAAAFGDQEALAGIAELFDQRQGDVVDAIERQEAAERAHLDARREYNDLVRLSNDDPDEFLRVCVEVQGG